MKDKLLDFMDNHYFEVTTNLIVIIFIFGLSAVISGLFYKDNLAMILSVIAGILGVVLFTIDSLFIRHMDDELDN